MLEEEVNQRDVAPRRRAAEGQAALLPVGQVQARALLAQQLRGESGGDRVGGRSP
jgi:hypothetical protein